MVEPPTRKFWQAHWRKDGSGPSKKVSRHVMPLALRRADRIPE